MEARIERSISTLVAAAACAASLHVAALFAADVYRWVDENGEVHYSESLPPDYKDKGYDVLNREGIVIDENLTLTPKAEVEVPGEDKPQELPRDSSGLPRPKALYSEAETQRRMDNFLMLRYESAQEIIDAMSVEIKQLEYDRRLLQSSLDSMNSAYRGHIRVAADQQRAGVPVTDETIGEINDLRSALARNEKSLEGLRQREESIRSDFDKQLERYRYLMENWSEDSSEP